VALFSRNTSASFTRHRALYIYFVVYLSSYFFTYFIQAPATSPEKVSHLNFWNHLYTINTISNH